MSSITVWEISDLLSDCLDFHDECINNCIAKYDGDNGLMKGIRYALLYYVRMENDNASSEQFCGHYLDQDYMTMMKLINDEISLEDQLMNCKINGMAMVVQYKNYINSDYKIDYI
ncbi:Hypothetical protein ORPV_246 [Orpheovirus IHUMI-LCC2]|uniref:Uncharacterized protein n=1 Tax=Orpheovirus IHUMI-LCC2 TaxID=2023057 RepID=A0A2I2L3Q7_9VIRU|nr:Hypothetical protein ORPV_246 [Orpheovirus IHUMI-LCC2]SNW62150.1 Hypothetical protein ORPV_246 [Orpheovirus IHUMI-LCC2]